MVRGPCVRIQVGSPRSVIRTWTIAGAGPIGPSPVSARVRSVPPSSRTHQTRSIPAPVTRLRATDGSAVAGSSVASVRVIAYNADDSAALASASAARSAPMPASRPMTRATKRNSTRLSHSVGSETTSVNRGSVNSRL